MTQSRHEVPGSPKARVGFRIFAFAVLAALFGLSPTAQAEDRGRGEERGTEDRGDDRGDRDRDKKRGGSSGHDVDSGEEDE